MKPNTAKDPKLLRTTAMGMAAAFWEEAERRAKTMDRKPGVPLKEFVRDNWMKFVLPARATLAELLSSSTVSDHMKAEIYDALTFGEEIEDAKAPPAEFLAQAERELRFPATQTAVGLVLH